MRYPKQVPGRSTTTTAGRYKYANRWAEVLTMKWCDCSHCVRRRVWEGWLPASYVGFIVIGTFQIFTDDFFGIATVVTNAFVLWITRLRKQRFVLEDHICKVELAVAMLKGDDDWMPDWPGTGIPRATPQPNPGRIRK